MWHVLLTAPLSAIGYRLSAIDGHGPAFAAMCNQIGEPLGLPPVRAMKRRGKDKDLPSCAQWPIYVRHPLYYLGAYVLGQANDDQAEQGNPLAALLDQILTHIDAGRIPQARAELARIRRMA
ncbi:MAG: hypothetical protein HGA65_18015 [Oscillochloris sp.]|nr:hypothetical protein [Oscillochloris sp.]